MLTALAGSCGQDHERTAVVAAVVQCRTAVKSGSVSSGRRVSLEFIWVSALLFAPCRLQEQCAMIIVFLPFLLFFMFALLVHLCSKW